MAPPLPARAPDPAEGSGLPDRPEREGPTDARILGVLRAEMARVRARLTLLSGRDPAELPRPASVLRFPGASSRDGILVAPGWGERRDLVGDWFSDPHSRAGSPAAR